MPDYTNPHDINDLGIWVMGWDDARVARQVEMLKSQGYKHVHPWIDRNHHETGNMNMTIDRAAEMGLAFWHMASDDVEYTNPETIPAMYDYLQASPRAGAIHPWVKGEDPEPLRPPYESYLQDGTAIVLRLDINGWLPRWDEEFLFTGWADIDLGMEINRHGGLVMNDRRYPVKHDWGNTHRRGKKAFLMAMERRNRLILTVKWDIVGINNWRGIEAYNRTVSADKRIPTMYEIANYTSEEQELFFRSVDYEHPPIYKQDGNVDPMLYWENPIVTGRNIREMWESGWRPS